MKFKVGDKVRVRSWESMEREFGLNENGNIKCSIETIFFVKNMKKYCGKIVEVKEIRDNYYRIKNDIETWNFTDDMLEPAFDWESFKDSDNKISVHCKTEEEAKDFCKQMHEHGMTWCTGASYLDFTNFDLLYAETCYEGNGTYCDRDWYLNKNYTILEWSDYMNTEKKTVKMTVEEMKKKLSEIMDAEIVEV